MKNTQGEAPPRQCSKVCNRKTHRSIRVHTTVLMRFRLPTLKRWKTIEKESISVGRRPKRIEFFSLKGRGGGGRGEGKKQGALWEMCKW